MGASPYVLLFFWLAAERDSLRSAAFCLLSRKGVNILANLKIEYVAIDSIKPYEGNAKLHYRQIEISEEETE
jgi:hypothetical protein